MGAPVRSKKMAVFEPSDVAAATGLLKPKMVRIGLWQIGFLRLDRRELLAGLGVTALLRSLSLDRGRPGAVVAGPAGQSRHRSPCGRERRIRRFGRWGRLSSPIHVSSAARQLEVTLGKRATGARGLNWRGIDGVPTAEPLAARAPLASGAEGYALAIPLRHAGTFLCDFRLLGDGQARPSPALPLIVAESEPVARRPRRSAPDRRLAAAAGWHRDRAGHRSQGHGAALHHQRAGHARHPRPPPTSGCDSGLSMAANAMLLLSK